MRNSMLPAILAALLVIVGALRAQDSGRVLIQGARIIPIVGEEIENGSILIENGKITAIGKDVKVPFDAKVIDATGKVVMPGAIDAFTSNGLDFANENVDNGSFLQVADALDPSDRYFEESLRNGLLTLHVSQGPNCVVGGVSRVVRPLGLTVQEMTVRADAGLLLAMGPKGGYDPSAQAAVMRGLFSELDRYLERLAEQLYEEDVKKKGEEVTVGPTEARKLGKDLVTLAKIDDAHRNLVRLRQGRLDGFIHCPRASNVASGLELAKAQGFLAKSTLIIGSECHKVAAALKQSGRPIVLSAGDMIHRERDRMTDEIVETFVPKILFDKKVSFAIADTVEPWYEAARCVRNGLPRQAALEALTLAAARAIGLESRLGSLEVGKDGTVVILSGDPFDTMTWVESAVIEGRQVYERSKDKSLRILIQGVHDTSDAEKKAAESKSGATPPKDAPATAPASAPAAAEKKD